MTIRLTPDEARRLGLKPTRAKRSPVDHREFKSGLERRYAEHLESRKILGEITSWRYECHRLAIGGGAWFMPDFEVVREVAVWPPHWFTRQYVEFHECKGFWREAPKLRMKISVEKYPEYAFFVVTAGGANGFNIERWSKTDEQQKQE